MSDAVVGRLDVASTRERFAWCLFDFANSAFNTIVVTFVYAAFFSRVLVGEAARGDVLWSHALTASGLLVAALSPWLGAIADQRSGTRRRFLIAFSALTIVCTALLAVPTPGPGAIVLALVLFTLANVGFELAFVFYNAFLPDLGDHDTIGRLSGRAWALGYAGGLLCLVIGLGFVGAAGLGPWLSTADGWNVRATNLLVAAWFTVFALPMFVIVRERRASTAAARTRSGWREVVHTLARLRDFPDLLRLLVARLFYNDAVLAIIGLAALYMERTLGMEIGEIMIVAIWLNVAAGIGAFGFGWIDDRVGARTAIQWSLVLLLAGGVLAIAIPTVPAFWVAATLVGIGLGPNQSASRSLLARFVPERKNGEFYGLFALSGKATAWLGPLLFGLVVEGTGSQRLGFAPLILMLAVGLWIVLSIDESRGIACAAAAGPALGEEHDRRA